MVRREKKNQSKSVRGTFTVEAAIVVPMVLFCIVWMMERGIALYMKTVEISQNQEMWETFKPAEVFRNLELLTELF